MAAVDRNFDSLYVFVVFKELTKLFVIGQGILVNSRFKMRTLLPFLPLKTAVKRKKLNAI